MIRATLVETITSQESTIAKYVTSSAPADHHCGNSDEPARAGLKYATANGYI